jgi:hypothetical protein
MKSVVLQLQIENATRTDLHELKRVHGDKAVVIVETSDATKIATSFGEPQALTLIVTAGSALVGALAAWILRQRSLRRTTLRITITNQKGNVTKIDLADFQYTEGKADSGLVSELVKAGLESPRPDPE